MGFFGKKGVCNICLNNTGVQAKDGFVCKECLDKCGPFGVDLLKLKDMTTISSIQKRINQNKIFQKAQEEREKIFSPTNIIGNNLVVDEDNQLWCFGRKGFKIKRMGAIYRMDEIVDYEIEEDENIITKSGLGRAVAGGVLFGGVGAIVGGITGGRTSKAECSKLNVLINVKDAPSKVVIPLLISKTKKNSLVYKNTIEFLTRITTYLDSIIDEVKNDISKTPSTDPYEDVKKLKELLDIGAITQEEFNAKKKQLLGL